MEVDGRRQRRRLMLRWKDKVANDMQEKGFREPDMQDRGEWARLTSKSDSHTEIGFKPEGNEEKFAELPSKGSRRLNKKDSQGQENSYHPLHLFIYILNFPFYNS